MDSPFFNLLTFLIVTGAIAVLFWPRLGLVQAVRRRLYTTTRSQLEDALKCMLKQSTGDDVVTLARLSEALSITPSRASDLSENMSRAGLVTVTGDRILLTAEGEQYALQIIRAHRLWERYLADQTGVNPKDWHTQAEEYEHKISPEELESLADQLGNPLFDPHGDPIPSPDEAYEEQDLVSLTELPIESCGRVMHLEDEPENVFHQLVALEIYPGMEFRLTAKEEGRFVIEADGRTIEIGPEAAANLSVEQVDAIDTSGAEIARESLDDLREGESASIVEISPMCRGFERRRLMDLGIVPNTLIQFYEDGLTGGLKAFSVRGTVLALRSEQIKMISITGRKRVTS